MRKRRPKDEQSLPIVHGVDAGETSEEATRLHRLGHDTPGRRQVIETAASEVCHEGSHGSQLILASAALIIVALSLFYRRGALTIQPFDEARLANNALEMSHTGLSLVTTFDGVTDYWNTKPPLLIWLMSGAIPLLGPDEFAVRLPSAVAALLTAVLMFTFLGAFLKKPLAGFVAVSILFSANGYLLQQPAYQITGHSARSGDYDSLLAFWTTAYVLAGFLYVHGGVAKRTTWMIASASAMALAFMTKTVQALIFLPALLLYVAVSRHCGQPARVRSFYMAVVLTLTACRATTF